MKTILVGIDFSPVTRAVLRAACRLATLMEDELCLAYVVKHPFPADYPGILMEAASILESANHAATRLMAQEVRRLERAGFSVAQRILSGVPGIEILREAEKSQSDYIVIGSHGHGALYELAAGSTTRMVLKGAPCPVVVVAEARRRRGGEKDVRRRGLRPKRRRTALDASASPRDGAP